MKIPETVQSWLNAKELQTYELLNLAFVPNRSFEGILDGSYPSIAARQRLYLVTKLDLFKLSESEIKEYNRQKSKPATRHKDVAGEEKIALFFIERWKRDGILPSKDESLLISAGKKQDKVIVRGDILKKYFSNETRPIVTPTNQVSKEKESVLEDSKNSPEVKTNNVLNSGDNLRRKLFEMINGEIITALESDEHTFQSFCKANANQMKQLKGLLNVVLGEDNPRKAYAQIKDVKKQFEP